MKPLRCFFQGRQKRTHEGRLQKGLSISVHLIQPLQRFYRPGSTHGKGVTGRLGTGAKTRTSADESRSSTITPFLSEFGTFKLSR